MPTYDYQCRSCGHTVELIHSMLDDGPSVCERCGGEMRRVLHPTGIIFKGSGFYKTDSRSSSSASVGGGTAKAEAAKPSGGESPSDTSSAPKSKPTTEPGSGTPPKPAED